MQSRLISGSHNPVNDFHEVDNMDVATETVSDLIERLEHIIDFCPQLY